MSSQAQPNLEIRAIADGLSDSWPGYVEQSAYLLFEECLSNINYDELKEHALRLRKSLGESSAQETTCEIDRRRFAYGSKNLVLKMAFADGVHWIARLAYCCKTTEEAHMLEREIIAMKFVKLRTTIPVPEVFGWNFDLSNPVGFGYSFMELIPCQALGTELSAVPEKFIRRVAAQLNTVLSVLKGLSFPKHGFLSSESLSQSQSLAHSNTEILEDEAQKPTSYGWFYDKINRQNHQALKDHLHDEDWLTACWVQKLACPHICIPDWMNGPFPLLHMNLHHRKILFDDEYNITAVLGWYNAQAGPLECLLATPEFAVGSKQSTHTWARRSKFRNLVSQALQLKESQMEVDLLEDQEDYQLSDFLQSDRWDLLYGLNIFKPTEFTLMRCRTLLVPSLYGDKITWDRLKEIYGEEEYR